MRCHLSNQCVFATGVRHEVNESSKRSPRQDGEGQADEAACVKMRKVTATRKMTTHKLQFGTHGFSSSRLYCIAAVGLGAQEAPQHY